MSHQCVWKDAFCNRKHIHIHLERITERITSPISLTMDHTYPTLLPACCKQTPGYSPWIFQLKYKLELIPFRILYIMFHLSLLEVLLNFLGAANILNQTPPLSGDTAAKSLSGRVRHFSRSCAVWMYDKCMIQPLTRCTQNAAICGRCFRCCIPLRCKLEWLAQVPQIRITLKKISISGFIWMRKILPTRILFGQTKVLRESFEKVRSYQKKRMVEKLNVLQNNSCACTYL